MNMALEEYKRMTQGQRSRQAGAFFEETIAASLDWHEARGILKADKTPEPMRPLQKPNKKGQFIACFTKKAQVDFCGTMQGGRAVRFEAKQTDTDRFERSRLTTEQMDDLRGHEKLGALCFVLLCFGVQNFYRVPWNVWDNMKAIYGRQYVKENDVAQYRIPSVAGVLKLLYGIVSPNEPTCDNCVHKKLCDVFFAEKYQRLGIKEPEALRNAGCKFYTKEAPT